jgi:hypothetical protein
MRILSDLRTSRSRVAEIYKDEILRPVKSRVQVLQASMPMPLSMVVLELSSARILKSKIVTSVVVCLSAWLHIVRCDYQSDVRSWILMPYDHRNLFLSRSHIFTSRSPVFYVPFSVVCRQCFEQTQLFFKFFNL